MPNALPSSLLVDLYRSQLIWLQRVRLSDGAVLSRRPAVAVDPRQPTIGRNRSPWPFHLRVPVARVLLAKGFPLPEIARLVNVLPHQLAKDLANAPKS